MASSIRAGTWLAVQLLQPGQDALAVEVDGGDPLDKGISVKQPQKPIPDNKVVLYNDTPYTLTITLLCNDSFSIVTEFSGNPEYFLSGAPFRLFYGTAKNGKTARNGGFTVFLRICECINLDVILSIALVLYLFILLINAALNFFLKRSKES